MIRSNQIEETVAGVLSAGTEGAEDGLYLVNPSRDAIRGLVAVLTETDAPPAVRLFAAEGPLKDLAEDFLVASTVSDLVESGTLSVRTLSEVPTNTLLVSESSVVALVESGQRVAALATTDETFVGETRETYEARWAEAATFGLRTPARSTVMETLSADIGPDAAADFAAVLDALEAARGNGDGLDEVTISLLVAARHSELLYDISKWGEDIGLASKATFSRMKSQLEESGLLDTEKVPIDVGRPRLRLLPGDDIASTDADELVATAQEKLA
ncbi:MAG: hypothetical protein BRD23_01250 [Halobacteriales archaeon SW_9_67_25]|jgi:hypothetical protein|nr:MAG: hypothetical protein BRD23_01250 [Halobacteriales archaeon SW_9_67_25]